MRRRTSIFVTFAILLLVYQTYSLHRRVVVLERLLMDVAPTIAAQSDRRID